jgi:hypothetical protein
VNGVGGGSSSGGFPTDASIGSSSKSFTNRIYFVSIVFATFMTLF